MMDEPGLLPMLTIVSGSMRGTSFRLSPGSRVIGRVESADIVIDDLQVSRRHAAVRLAGGQVSLADMGSTNGTWLNDQRLCGVERLTDGDISAVSAWLGQQEPPKDPSPESSNLVRMPFACGSQSQPTARLPAQR